MKVTKVEPTNCHRYLPKKPKDQSDFASILKKQEEKLNEHKWILFRATGAVQGMG